MRFSIVQTKDGKHRVTRTDMPGDMHTHIDTEDTAKLFVKLLRCGILPDSVRLQESARRVTTEKEYSQLRPKGEKKQRYYNVGKKARRVI